MVIKKKKNKQETQKEAKRKKEQKNPNYPQIYLIGIFEKPMAEASRELELTTHSQLTRNPERFSKILRFPPSVNKNLKQSQITLRLIEYQSVLL